MAGPSSADSSSASALRSTEATPWLRVFRSWMPRRVFTSQSNRREMQCQKELENLRRWFQKTHQELRIGPGRQADPAGLESHRSTPAASDPHQTKRAASERSFRLGDSWSLRGLEGGFSRDGNGELGKENDGGREKQVEKKGEKGRVKSMGFKGDRNVQEDKEARVRRRLAERRQTRARLADCVPCTSDNDGEDSKLQGFQSGQGGERDENAGGGDSGSELEGSRKLLQESAPCCDPLVLKLRVQTADLERRMGQIAEKQVSFDEQVRFDEQAESKRVSREKYVLNKKLSRADANWEALFLSNQSMHEAQMTVQRCNGHGIVAQQGTLVWKGYTCDAPDEALTQYTTYDASGACPDDWFPHPALTFHHHCFLIPPPLLIFPASQSLVLPPLPPPRATHGYTCDASDEALTQYTSYDASGAWPDDWFPTQSLIFHHRCFQGYTCDASDEALTQYTTYDASGACPDDWFPTQSLIFHHRCFQGYTCDAADEALTQYTTYDASGACPDDWFPTQALIFHHHCQLIPPPLPLFCSPPPQGYTCDASDEALRQYTTYDASGACPDDWFPTQALIFHHHCQLIPPPLPLFCSPPPQGYTCDAADEALTQYTTYDASGACPDDWFATSPSSSTIAASPCRNPLPRPHHQPNHQSTALPPGAIQSERPNRHSPGVGPPRLLLLRLPQRPLGLDIGGGTGSFAAHMGLYNVTILTTCRPFLALFTPPPSILLGLDIGGGTGSFAAHMALYNVTILTTAMNVETVVGRKQGLPYMEAIALRGLIPLHLPHKSLATILTTAMNVETVVGRKQGWPAIHGDRGDSFKRVDPPAPSTQASSLPILMTILPTAMNVETVVGRKHGLPCMEAIALRGLIDLHLLHKVDVLLSPSLSSPHFPSLPVLPSAFESTQKQMCCSFVFPFDSKALSPCPPIRPAYPSLTAHQASFTASTASSGPLSFLLPPCSLCLLSGSSTLLQRRVGHHSQRQQRQVPSPSLHDPSPLLPFPLSLVPPHQARLPFFDGALDIIHSVNSVKYLPMLEFEEMLFDINSVKYLPVVEFEEMLFEWDRVLRVGESLHRVNSVKYLPMLEFEELLFVWDRVLRVRGVIWLEMFYAPLDEFPVYVAILNLLGYNHLHWRVLPSPSLPCPPPPSGGVIWLEMFYAPLDEFPVYVAILNLLSYNRLHWRVLPKPDPGERKGPHVYLNCLLEKPVRREEGWVEAGRDEGRGEEEGGREVGGREGGTSEETGGKEEGMEREVGGREEGGRREEGRREGSSNHRSEGDVEKGRRIEGEGIGEGSRQWGAEEDRKRDERNGKMERKEEERKEEAVKEDSNRTEERGREEERREERRERRREYGSEEWNEEVVEEAGTSIEKFAREWYREEEGSRETEGSRENGGSREQGAAREDEIQTAKEKEERPSWCEEDYTDGGRGRRGAGGSEDDSGWGKELFGVHRTPKDGASKVIVVFEKSQKRKSARDGGRGRRGGGGSEDDSGFGKKPFRVHRTSKDGASKVIVVFEKSQKRKSARDGGRGRRGGGGSEDDSGFGKKPFRVHRTSKDGASKVIVVFEKSQKRKSARDGGRGRRGGGGSEDDSGFGKKPFRVHRTSKDGASKVIVVFEKSQKRKSARDRGRGRSGGGGSEDDSGWGKELFGVR
ncbi:unnamed protein product [Closterium sp. NIES-65]|nr:unnamed protein product [Closterium sp. NIES-65]